MFGLRFKESGNFVPLGKDIVFPMRFKNPLLVEEDNFQAMWSLPVSLPYSEALWRELKIPDNPNVVKPNSAQHEVDLLVAKALHYDGTLQLLRADKNRAEVNVWDKLFPDGFGEQTIKEVMDGVSYDVIDFDPFVLIQFTGTPAFDTWTFNYGDLSWDIFVLGGYTIDDVLTNLQLQINLGESTHGLHATNLGGDEFKIEDSNMWTNGFIVNDLSVSGSAITIDSYDWLQWVKDYHEELQDQMKIVSEEETQGLYNYTYFPVYNPYFYGDENPDFTGWINGYNNNMEKFMLNIDVFAYAGHKYTVVPFIYFKTVFDKIFADAGITVSGNFVERQGFKQFVIYNTQSLDMWYAHESVVVFNKTITVKKHLPDMTVRDFLLEFRKLYNLKYDFNKATGELIITERQNALNRVVKTDWRRKLQATNPEYTFQNADGFTFSSAHDTGDELSEFFALQHDEYVYGNGLSTINSAWSWPSVEEVLYEAGGLIIDEYSYAKVPSIKQKGCSDVYQFNNSFTPRLLLYRGWAPDSLGFYIPYASNDSYDSQHFIDQGTTGENTYDLTLVWSKLFAEFYSEWVEFFDSTITCEVSLILPLTDIQLYNLDTFYMFEESDWLVDEIELGNVYADDILCRAKLVRETS